MSKLEKDIVEYCPNCNANLQGEEIPKEKQHLYGATHFSRKIGWYSEEKDRTVSFICPECGEEWEARVEDALADIKRRRTGMSEDISG